MLKTKLTCRKLTTLFTACDLFLTVTSKLYQTIALRLQWYFYFSELYLRELWQCWYSETLKEGVDHRCHRIDYVIDTSCLKWNHIVRAVSVWYKKRIFIYLTLTLYIYNASKLNSSLFVNSTFYWNGISALWTCIIYSLLNEILAHWTYLVWLLLIFGSACCFLVCRLACLPHNPLGSPLNVFVWCCP